MAKHSLKILRGKHCKSFKVCLNICRANQLTGFYIVATLMFNILMMMKGTAWKKYTSKTYI